MNETIAAISSAPGEGAIGIVRISGGRAEEILSRLFRRTDGSAAESFEDRKLYYGMICAPAPDSETSCRGSKNFPPGAVIDEVLAVSMKKPHTYTREDIVEIYCHGSHISVRKILEAALTCGAVLAAPGEFTKRAFLNGRIDLAQADAVIDLIKAGTDLAHESALGRLGGNLSNRIREIRSGLADALAEAVANLDYPNEDENPSDSSSAAARIADMVDGAAGRMRELIETASAGRMVRDGVNVVIAGKPNVGKSSLLNALLRESRAIVSDIPGTTRDRIEEYANVHGIPVRFTDTAGIREAEGEIERVGIDMAADAARGADIVLFVADGSAGVDKDDKKVAEIVAPSGEKTALLIVSKSDMRQVIDLTEAGKLMPFAKAIFVSSVTGDGIAELEDGIADLVFGGKTASRESLLVADVRQKNLLIRAESEALEATHALRSGEPLDFAEVNIKAAYDALGEVIGETVTEDILDRVFERFCIGK